MVRCYGLTHLNLAVRDLDRSVAFYVAAFGAREYARVDGVAHLQGPGPHDILSLDGTASSAGSSGGIAHFGFRLVDPGDLDEAIESVTSAGGRLLRRGEFAPGVPYAYVADPDGYEIELWYE
jgi:catechol 2,3-dioxygenase-like lactoylglutathione lyase family enzyme